MRALPHRRLQCSEATKILDCAGKQTTSFETFISPDAPVDARWFSEFNGEYNPHVRWVTALFVQFRFLHAKDTYRHHEIRDQFRAQFESDVYRSGGDVLALSPDAAFALFSGGGLPQDQIRSALEVVIRLMAGAEETNRQRLAHNLSPLRLGIGLVAGTLQAHACNRHPRLDPGIEAYLNRARRLSELNVQAPFPTAFVSREVAGLLYQAGPYEVQELGSVALAEGLEPFPVYAYLHA